MKKFKFSLERMLNYQEQLLQREKNIMAQMMEEKNSLERKKESLEGQMEEIHRQMNQDFHKGTTIFKIRSYTTLDNNARRQREDIMKHLKMVEQEIEKQRTAVVSASQEVSKLEKLKEKQLEEYRYAEAKELEEQVCEHISGKLIRQGVS